ncbi:MAG: hypothetical protein WCE68_07160 [Anaerolineales bacterium]
MFIMTPARSPRYQRDAILSWVKHGLQNTGGTPLKYLSACSPPFTIQQCLERWPLPSQEESNS